VAFGDWVEQSGILNAPGAGEDQSIFSRTGEALQGAFDDFWGSVGRGAERALNTVAEQGGRVVEEALPIWAENLLRQQREDQLDDPTIGDLWEVLRNRLADDLRTTAQYQETATMEGTLFPPRIMGTLEPKDIAIIVGIVVVGIVLAIKF
jgi:hypothetical protein